VTAARNARRMRQLCEGMTHSSADVVVIGLGPGGGEVAARLLDAGLSVVGVERELVGGECPYWGCIPSKMAVRAAGALAEARRVPLLAGTAEVRPDFGAVARRIRAQATDDWDDAVAVARFEKAGGRFVRGTAVIEERGQVRVGDEVITAGRGVVVATGSAPVRPPIPGLAGSGYWTNREAIAAKEAPASLVVLGGGAIGLELAQAFARFGSGVTVVEGADRVLPLEEPEASAVVTAALGADGVAVRAGRRASAVARGDGRITVTLDDDTTVTGEELLVAVGRRSSTSGLGLEHYGVAGPALAVDGRCRAAPGLWAVGDVTGVGAFTHLAVHQAGLAVADILGAPHPPADYTALPRVTFTDPEVGSVGRTEGAARAAGLPVAVGTASTAATSRGFVHGPGNDGLVKLVVDPARDLLVGATAVGPTGGEVLGLLALAVHARVPVGTLESMILAYPTFTRGVRDALADLRA
jgi:pyruvate/2-oxoglutarate dehydrogenase complex dihydrolipoamide dehydrogenase (E3) component